MAPQQLGTAGLGPPGVLLQGGEQRGEDELHPVAAEVGHDGPGCLVCGLADVLVPVPEAEEQVGEEVHHVGLEQPAEHVAEGLEGEQGALAMAVVLLVLDGFLERRHDFELLEGRDAEALDQPSQSVGCSLSLAVTGRVQ